MGSSEALFFGIFLFFIGGMLAIDLGLFTTKDHKVNFKEAALWSGVWVSLALIFYFLLRFHGNLIHGVENMEELTQTAGKYAPGLGLHTSDFEAALRTYNHNLSLEFLTGYLIEYALS